MEFKGVITKKGIELGYEVRLDRSVWFYFENEALTYTKELTKGLRFKYIKGQDKLNKALGIEKSKQINGINLEECHLEELKKVVETVKEYVLTEAKKIAEDYNGEIKLNTGHHIWWQFDLDSSTHYVITEKAEKLLEDKYNLDIIDESTIKYFQKKLNCIDTDMGEYTVSRTYLVTTEEIKKMLEYQEKAKKELECQEKTRKELEEKKDMENGFYDYELEVLSNCDTEAKVKVTEKATRRAKIYFCRNIFDFG